ncbi:MAG: putative Zn-binding protein involved in type VI secretion [Crocinitomix sp.]|jgi:uncharacterized Zn-binding protein involved in type VI secretion
MAAGVKVGDITNHGGIITGPGVPTVLLEGIPAAVVLDMHACVLPPPHAPASPFPIGSMTVLIGGKPALRVGDTCLCGASAIIGAPTILIG